jgi:hypothetical protein
LLPSTNWTNGNLCILSWDYSNSYPPQEQSLLCGEKRECISMLREREETIKYL